MRGNPNPDKDNASVDPVSSALTGRENAKTPRSEVEPNPTPTSIVPEPCSEALIGATHKRQETAEEDNTETELQRLALLDPLEYDRERNEAAKRLGAQLKTLDAEVTKRRPKTNSSRISGVVYISCVVGY